MLPLLLRRLLWSVPVLLSVALVTFALMRLAPGGPFDRSPGQRRIAPAARQSLAAYYGIDRPPYLDLAGATALWRAGERSPAALTRAALDSQLIRYLANAMRGDLGPSYQQRGRRVQEVLGEQWPYSLRLGALAAAVALLTGLPLGLLAALRPGSAIDGLCIGVANIGTAVPAVVVAMLTLIVFGTQLGWIAVATSDWQQPRSYVAPALVLALGVTGGIARLTRAAVLDVAGQDFVRVARAKGLSERMLVLRHILPGSLVPVLTIAGPAFVDLVTGAVVVEAIFGVPGIGRTIVAAVAQRDYSMIMGSTLEIAALVVCVTTLVDLCAMALDPRLEMRR